MRLAFVFIQGRLARHEAVEQGKAATEFFYGAIELARKGIGIDFHEVDSSRPGTKLRYLLDRLIPRSIRPVKMELSIVSQCFFMRSKLNQSDCIVATGGNIAFALALLKVVGLITRPIVGIQCGVLSYRHNLIRRLLSRLLLGQMKTILFGEGELASMKQLFSLSPDRISINQFGVDVDFWTPGAASGDYVLSVGNDAHRDYPTLMRAAQNIPVPVRIVTRLEIPGPLPPNVSVIQGDWHRSTLTDHELRELYRNARVVVVPVQATQQPSGQSVTLQAMACGKPVVLTRTDGLWSKITLIDGDNVLFSNPNDPQHLAAQVRRLLEDQTYAKQIAAAGRASVFTHGTTIERFAHRLEKVCREAMGLN